MNTILSVNAQTNLGLCINWSCSQQILKTISIELMDTSYSLRCPTQSPLRLLEHLFKIYASSYLGYGMRNIFRKNLEAPKYAQAIVDTRALFRIPSAGERI